MGEIALIRWRRPTARRQVDVRGVLVRHRLPHLYYQGDIFDIKPGSKGCGARGKIR